MNNIIAIYTRSGYPSSNVITYSSDYAGTPVNTLIISGPNGYNGGIVYNDPPYPMFDSSGNYTGDTNWASSLTQLKNNTNITNIFFSIGNSAISALAAMGSSNLNKVLVSLKNSGITGVDIDAENWGQPGGLDPMDPAVQTVTLAVIQAGLALTAAPYNNLSGWQSWQTFVNNTKGGHISWFNVQCYAGGTGNDPVQGWYTQFTPSVPIVAGFEATNSGTDGGQLTPTQALQTIQSWQSEVPQNSLAGAFVWEFSLILDGGNTVAEYATAMEEGLNTYYATYTLTPGGALVPDAIRVASNLNVNIYINNSQTNAVIGQFAATPEVTCPAGETTLLYNMNGGNSGLTDYINITSLGLSSSLIWE